MKNIIIGLICMVSPLLTFGHNPLSARYYLEANEQVSLLTVNLSRDGINQALIKQYGSDRLQAFSKNELEKVIVDYIKRHFNLSYDDINITLSEGGIKLGSHQTDLKFVLPPILNNFDKMTIAIQAFKENKNHQTIFSYNINGIEDYTILSSPNNYQSTIKLKLKTSGIGYRQNWIFIIGLIIIAVLLLIKKAIRYGLHTTCRSV